jgi:predicted dienelactone hydrolase
MRTLATLLILFSIPLIARGQIPSRPGVGSPELAFAGPLAVGVKSMQLIDHAQVDPTQSTKTGHLVHADRVLPLTVWYPARPGGHPTPYTATLTSEPPRPPAGFHIPAMAVRDAPATGEAYPIVVVSHGYNNDPVMLSWLTENLATKGYVVVAISHNDPPITDRSQLPDSILRRPLDIAFVVRSVREGLLQKLGDPNRIALAGYSMGGYGVLTAAGARLNPASPIVAQLSKELVAEYASGGTKAEQLSVGDVKAVIAIAPAGGGPWFAWRDGLSGIHAPLMIIAGEADRNVGYTEGPAALFRDASNSDRYLLVFHGAGHSLGVDPAPNEMRDRLWDLDWFEDPIWRKDRLNAISLHFITAFLDLNLKGDQTRAAYLKTSSEESKDAAWSGPETPYDAVSDGGNNPAWKGFPRNHQGGLLLRHLDAGAPQ